MTLDEYQVKPKVELFPMKGEFSCMLCMMIMISQGASRKLSLTCGMWKTATNSEIIRSKQILKVKYKINGSIERYNAWLMAIGYIQREDVDDKETF